MKTSAFKPQFVDTFPEHVDMVEGVLYVSMHFASVAHLCACGCGLQVVTPLRPGSWNMTYDGRTVGLHPSIGNFQFPCRSHYFIRNGNVVWVPDAPDSRGRKRRSWFHRFFNPKSEEQR